MGCQSRTLSLGARDANLAVGPGGGVARSVGHHWVRHVDPETCVSVCERERARVFVRERGCVRERERERVFVPAGLCVRERECV